MSKTPVIAASPNVKILNRFSRNINPIPARNDAKLNPNAMTNEVNIAKIAIPMQAVSSVKAEPSIRRVFPEEIHGVRERNHIYACVNGSENR
ncbi:MAG: hypothetical protein QS99_C0005G0045 [archaeon GW2011_AR4]|nr:MAG: hypothetical protein QS99_C0005G0045 [archaeon GW2011_AR4]